MYIIVTLIPSIPEGMLNDTTKAKILENYGLTDPCEETGGEWIINIVLKYYYAFNNDYAGGHEKKDYIWYRWTSIDCYILLDQCMLTWIQMTSEESKQYKGY